MDDKEKDVFAIGFTWGSAVTAFLKLASDLGSGVFWWVMVYMIVTGKFTISFMLR